MITEFKMFEVNSSEPQINDYGIANIDNTGSPEYLKEFIKNSICQIINVKEGKDSFTNFPYVVKYFKIPTDILYAFESANRTKNTGLRWLKLDDLKYWSPNKKDMEKILIQKRFDL